MRQSVSQEPVALRLEPRAQQLGVGADDLRLVALLLRGIGPFAEAVEDIEKLGVRAHADRAYFALKATSASRRSFTAAVKCARSVTVALRARSSSMYGSAADRRRPGPAPGRFVGGGSGGLAAFARRTESGSGLPVGISSPSGNSSSRISSMSCAPSSAQQHARYGLEIHCPGELAHGRAERRRLHDGPDLRDDVVLQQRRKGDRHVPVHSSPDLGSERERTSPGASPACLFFTSIMPTSGPDGAAAARSMTKSRMRRRTSAHNVWRSSILSSVGRSSDVAAAMRPSTDRPPGGRSARNASRSPMRRPLPRRRVSRAGSPRLSP